MKRRTFTEEQQASNLLALARKILNCAQSGTPVTYATFIKETGGESYTKAYLMKEKWIRPKSKVGHHDIFELLNKNKFTLDDARNALADIKHTRKIKSANSYAKSLAKAKNKQQAEEFDVEPIAEKVDIKPIVEIKPDAKTTHPILDFSSDMPVGSIKNKSNADNLSQYDTVVADNTTVCGKDIRAIIDILCEMNIPAEITFKLKIG